MTCRIRLHIFSYFKKVIYLSPNLKQSKVTIPFKMSYLGKYIAEIQTLILPQQFLNAIVSILDL